MPNHDKEPDKEFDDAFKMFTRMEELKEAINNSKGTKKERLQEEYIELLKNDNKSLEKTALKAESRVPSLSDDPPDNAPKKNKGGRPLECDSYNAIVYQAVQAMVKQRNCSIREAQRLVARYSDTDDGVSPGKKRTFPAIETAYKRGNL